MLIPPKYLQFAATTRVLLIAFVGVLLLMLLGFPMMEEAVGAKILDLQMDGYDRASLTALMEAYGLDGRNIHAIATATLDVLAPAIYGTFYIGLIHRMTPAWRWAILVPVVLVAVDLLENIQHIVMLLMYPDLGDLQIALGSMSVQIKGNLILASLLVVLASVAYGGIQRLRGRGRMGVGEAGKKYDESDQDVA